MDMIVLYACHMAYIHNIGLVNPCKMRWQLGFYVFEAPVGKYIVSRGRYTYIFLLAFKKKGSHSKRSSDALNLILQKSTRRLPLHFQLLGSCGVL